MRIRIGNRSSSRSSNGTLVWVLVPMGLTVALAYQAWGRYQSMGFTVETAAFAGGAVFTLIMGLSMIRSWRTGRTSETRLEAAREEFAEEPWKIRPEWRDSRFEAEPYGRRNLLFMAILWNLFTWPLAVFVIRSEFSNPTPDRAVLMVLIFPAVGLILAAVAIRGAIQRRKFGTTVIELDTIPVPLGGRLQGRVLTGIAPRDTPPEGFRVMLSCYRRRVKRTRSSNGGSSREVDLDLLWRDETRMRGIPVDANTRLAVPISFELPENQPESTAERSENRMLWQIDVSADLPGVDYEASIEIPVFQVEGAVGEAHPEDSATVGAVANDESYGRYELGADLTGPRSPGIEMTEPARGRIEFFFDRARDKSTIVITGLVSLACFGALTALVLSGRWPGVIVTLILIVIGGAFGFVAWRAWAYTSTVTVDRERVQVVRGAFGRGEPTVIPSSDVTDVKVVVSGRSGSGAKSKTSYRLEIERIATDEERLTHEQQLQKVQSLTETLGFKSEDGESVSDKIAASDVGPRPKVQVADGLADKQEADWIALRIMEAAVGARPGRER